MKEENKVFIKSLETAIKNSENCKISAGFILGVLMANEKKDLDILSLYKELGGK